MECNICCKKYTLIHRKKITCPYCQYEICIDCTKKYLINFADIPKCSNCKKIWTYDFMSDTLPKNFMNSEYRLAKLDFLYKRESNREITTNEYIYFLRRKSTKYSDILRNIMLNKIEELYNNITKVEEKKEENKKIKIISKCLDEKCEGVIKNDNYLCSTCSNKLCKKCFNYIKDEHICNEKDIESVKFIKNSSMPCPNCGTFIFKSEGCNDMFCTNCHSGFNYRTGELIKGNFHNVHRIEYLSKLKTTITQNNCEEFTFNYILYDDTLHFYYYYFIYLMTLKLQEYIRNINEYIRKTDEIFKEKKMKFMLDKLFNNTKAEKLYKESIYKVDLKINKEREFISLFDMIVHVFQDLLSSKSLDAIKIFVIESTELIKNFNNKYNRSYKTTIEILNHDIENSSEIKLLYSLYYYKIINIDYTEGLTIKPYSKEDNIGIFIDRNLGIILNIKLNIQIQQLKNLLSE